MTPSPLRDADATPLARKFAARLAAGARSRFTITWRRASTIPKHGYYRTRSCDWAGRRLHHRARNFAGFRRTYWLMGGRGLAADGRARACPAGRAWAGTRDADGRRASRSEGGARLPVRRTVHFIESSTPLQEAQRAALAEAPVRMSWHDGLAGRPGWSGDPDRERFFDCLPVQQFVFDAASEAGANAGSGWRVALSGSLPDPSGKPRRRSTPRLQMKLRMAQSLEHRPAVGGIMKLSRRVRLSRRSSSITAIPGPLLATRSKPSGRTALLAFSTALAKATSPRM